MRGVFVRISVSDVAARGPAIDEALPSVRRYLTANSNSTTNPFQLYQSIDSRLRRWRDNMLDQAASPSAFTITAENANGKESLPSPKSRRLRASVHTFLDSYTSPPLNALSPRAVSASDSSQPNANGEDSEGSNSDGSDHEREPVERRGHAEWRAVAKEDPFLILRDPLPSAHTARTGSDRAPRGTSSKSAGH